MILVQLLSGSLLVTLDDDAAVTPLPHERVRVVSPRGAVEVEVGDTIAADLMRRLALGPISLANVVGGASSPRLLEVLRDLKGQLAVSLTIAGDWRPIVSLSPTTSAGFDLDVEQVGTRPMQPTPDWRLADANDGATSLDLAAPNGTCRARLDGPGRRVALAIAAAGAGHQAVEPLGDVSPGLAGDIVTLLYGAGLVAPRPQVP